MDQPESTGSDPDKNPDSGRSRGFLLPDVPINERINERINVLINVHIRFQKFRKIGILKLFVQ